MNRLDKWLYLLHMMGLLTSIFIWSPVSLTYLDLIILSILIFQALRELSYIFSPLVGLASVYFCSNILLFVVPGKFSRISSYGINSNYRALHCLCPAHLLQSYFGSQVFCSRPFQLGSIRNHCGLGCSNLGCNYFSSVLFACCLPYHQRHS